MTYFQTLKPAQGLNYLFLDLNSYFASVEQQETPHLRGKPVAVVPMDTDSTCAIAVSYEAKAYGVKTGTKIYHAKRLCPGLKCIPARHHIYVDYHNKIMAEVERHQPIDNVHSIDEVSCRLTGPERIMGGAISLAKSIKKGIADNKQIGPYIKCSIGLAPNCYLAKLATDLQKPDGLVVLRLEDLPERIAHLSLTDLPGINTRLEARLLRCGVRTVLDLWNLEPWHARKIWGGVQGERFWYRLRGYDIPKTATQKRTIGHSRILAPEIRSPQQSRLVARALLIKATKRLRRHQLAATTLSFSACPIERPRFETTCTFPATQDSFVFLDAFETLWQNMLQTCGAHIRLKKVSVNLFDLVNAHTNQLSLFEHLSPHEHLHQQKQQKLWNAIDKLNNRFGVNTISLASQSSVSAQYLGTKIAFTRIPDAQEFVE
ncbi:MAG: impB/mucB/samB family protein [Pseudomonadota bacterium]